MGVMLMCLTHLAPTLLLLLNGKKLDNIFMFDFLQDLHFNIMDYIGV